MNCGIYIIQNVVNHKVYAGSSKNLKARKYDHWYKLKRGTHPNPHLQSAWNGYGEQVFHWEILEYCEPIDLVRREDWWIDFFGSRNREKGYNLLPADRHEISEETRSKISAVLRGRKLPREQVERSAAGHRGIKHPPEAVAKRVAKLVGQKRTEEQRERMSTIHKEVARSRGFTENHRLQLSQARKTLSERISKVWIVEKPDGESRIVKNLRQFCKENGLSTSGMQNVAYGYSTHYKGWKCRKVEETNF